MYSDVVMEVGKKYFEQLIDEMKEARGVTLDTELTADDLKELAEKFKTEYREKLGEEFPQDPKVQLMGAIKAVFRSWDNPRAIYYRRMNDIPPTGALLSTSSPWSLATPAIPPARALRSPVTPLPAKRSCSANF